MTTLSKMTIAKAVGFLIIGIVAAVLVSNTLRVPVGGSTTTYKILFTDAEGLLEGNPVSFSGVRIGRVDDITLRPDAAEDGTSLAEVTVSIKSDQTVPDNVHAAVRYGDMLGARYIALTPGGDGTPARDGNTIPLGATKAPVNLTALMNGFEPLFSALDPDQVNTLADGFVNTFEGRPESVKLLLEQISSMGSNLANNSAIFTRLLANLTVILDTVGEHSPQLTQLFNGLNDLTSAIVGDNGQLASLIDSGDKAVGALAEMMTAAGDDFRKSLTTLNDVTASWIPNTAEFEKFLTNFPQLSIKLNQSGRYGGFMMLYLCNFTLKAFPLEANIFGPTHSPVCM